MAAHLAEQSALTRAGNSVVTLVVSSVETKEQHLAEWMVAPRVGRSERRSVG